MQVNQWVDQVSGVTFTPVGGAAGIPELQPQSATMGGASTVKFGLSASGGQTMIANYTSGSYWCGANYTVVAIVRGQQENYNLKSAEYLRVLHTGAGTPYFFGSSRFSSSETPSGYKPTFIYSPPSTYRVGVVSSQQNAASAPMIAVFHAQASGHNMSFNGVSGIQNLTQMVLSPACVDSGLMTIGITISPPGPGTASMEIAELMVYDWDVDAEQELKLGCYAAQKYGIPTFVGNCN
jgi:hypothetical protein